MVRTVDPALNAGAAPAAPTGRARPAPEASGRTRLTRVGVRLTTSPGRMQLAMVAVVVSLLVLGTVGSGALGARRRAAETVGRQAEPLVAGAGLIYSSLADADATAASAFLTPGLEPPERRQSYLADIGTAGSQLATVARQAGSSPEAVSAIAIINKDLPVYTGLIEAARANNRGGLPVGAAYLREGSALMQTEILPAVGRLFHVAADRLDRAYQSGWSLIDTGGVLFATALALAALVLTQRYLLRRTHRFVNIQLAAASLLVLLLAGWTLAAFSLESSRLVDARRRGSDPVQLTSSARILVSRAVVDENLALVARGSGSQYLADFDAVIRELGPPDASKGLIGQVASIGDRNLPSLYSAFLAAHQQVVTAANSGQFAKSVELATGSAPADEFPGAARLTGALSGRIDVAQRAFAGEAAAASDDLAYLILAVVAITVIAALLAVVGIRQRLNEYR